MSLRSLLQFAGIVGALLAGCHDPASTSPAKSDGNRARKARQLAGPAASKKLPQTQARFSDVTASSGIEFTYQNGEEAGHVSILESLGGGVAVLDYDADGRMDLYFPGGGEFMGREIRGRPGALYRNQGRRQFAETTEQADVHQPGDYTHGAAAADYDCDGFPDLLVTGYGGLAFYRNQGDGTFVETAEAAGLSSRLWSASAAWGDIDGDGRLDLYVAHYVDWSWKNHPFCAGPKREQREVCSPRSFGPLPDALYISNGDGTFREASREAGLRDDGKGLGVLMADIDLDGRLDIYVANDTTPNFLYRNTGAAKLREAGQQSGTGYSDGGIPDGSMGVDLGDFNLDGRPDLWVSNFERESLALYRNEGNGLFQHVSRPMGVTAVGGTYVGWGTAFFDFENDGDEDLFVATGHVNRYPVNAPVRQPPLLFENRRGQRLVNVASAAGPYMAAPHAGRGVAVGDLDNDGDLDLAVSHVNEPVALLANESAGGNHWLCLRLIGIRSNRAAIGAIVRLKTTEEEQIRQVKGGTSYASTNDPRVFFGLGESERIERIEIRWPSGITQTLPNAPADQFIDVREPVAESRL